ncbi:hypothetical protein CHU92_12810 [Flavobacterium cyanobacteriorum]|uniref:Uncharacterized protein n=1 Tax=Flavobacterium cyanobacteriorum TaxID=2022802 RepID=A0A255YVM9_9FLAO|nr:hypothetical protein CHU92_12810 [Flavobacterium cyanobacteriorum]
MNFNIGNSYRKHFILLCLIFLISSILLVLLAETIWFPIRYSNVDNFIYYFSTRNKPFDNLLFAFKHIYCYYILTYLIMTISYIYFNSTSFVLKRSFPLRYTIVFLMMFLTSLIIYAIHRFIVHKGSFNHWAKEVFLKYIEMVLHEHKIVLLYLIVVLFCTIIYDKYIN